MNMMIATFTKTLQDHIRILRGCQRVDKWILPAGEVILLDIDNEKSCFHIVEYSRSLKWSPTSSLAGGAREDVGLLREPFLMQKRPKLEMNLGLLTESKLDSSNYILWSTLVCTFFRVFLCKGFIDKI